MKRNIFYRSVCAYLGMLLGFSACVDDEIHRSGDIPKGETVINAVVDFKAMSPALETRSAAGDALKTINSLWVLAYDLDGNLQHTYTGNELVGYQETEVEHSGEHVAETKTPRATFQLKIPYGVYKIYAVANVNLDAPEYAEAIKTIKGLKGISFVWNEKEIARNNQALGYFTEEDVVRDDSDPIRIDQRGMTFRAKMRRLASKVTLAFDGSMLHEGVFLYIKSAQIKDIPTSCFLGNKNKIKEEGEMIENGDTLQYVAPGMAYNDQYPARITKGRPYFPHDENYKEAFHSETERALYFYENMQGKDEGKDKKQDPANMGKKQKGEKGYKDDVEYGTYIEVQAYYHSINPDRLGAGDIVYRFMLGKDVINDFDAERNHHYRLTLMFKNFANDVDWHIDYDEPDPGLIVPDIFYISHLYNHSMMMPIKVNVGGGYKFISLTAKIDTNSWAPEGASASDYYEALDPYKHPDKLKNHTGFLSLRESKDKVVAPDLVVPKPNPDNKHIYNYGVDLMNNALKEYYSAKEQGERTYENHSAEEYTVSMRGDTVCNIQIPLYTRAKQLAPQSAYTGSNPYESYRRKAVVVFEATLSTPDNKEMIIRDTSIIRQERRLVNPTGIWRKHDSDASFHVLLQSLKSESSTNFEPFTSEGKWRAYVLKGDKNFVTLNKKDTVYGKTGTPIDFNINLNGKIGKQENRFAIIQIDYHDYSCQHLIFVRQGDEPVALVNGGKKWLTYNMRTATQPTESPCEEGSLFRFGKGEYPIDATNNTFEDRLKDNSNTKFFIAGTTDTKMTWDKIGSVSTKKGFYLSTEGIRIAKHEDYQALYEEGNHIENGYGVLYGNDATETQNTVEGAYRYRYDKQGKGYGMRGCFVYNSEDGRHIFFPIGASGYGHRKTTDGAGKAVLKYAAAARTGNFDWPDRAPLFWDAYKRPGAIYWLQELNGVRIGWDFNYFTFDFNGIDQANFVQGTNRDNSDACFIRCVVDE